jgi:N utilization substance protein B
VALQVLYAVDLAGRRAGDAGLGTDEAFELVSENFELPEGARAFAKELVNGIVMHRAELDALIGEHATNWRLSRMAAVDRNILRLGAYELVHTDTPRQVVLDEAVELARRFGDDPSPAFVNGVLDAVGRAVANSQPEPARAGDGGEGASG